jgi:hypothetical protein
VNHVIAADYQGGWVEEYRLLKDGTVETTRFEGALKRPHGYDKRRSNAEPPGNL